MVVPTWVDSHTNGHSIPRAGGMRACGSRAVVPGQGGEASDATVGAEGEEGHAGMTWRLRLTVRRRGAGIAIGAAALYLRQRQRIFCPARSDGRGLMRKRLRKQRHRKMWKGVPTMRGSALTWPFCFGERLGGATARSPNPDPDTRLGRGY